MCDDLKGELSKMLDNELYLDASMKKVPKQGSEFLMKLKSALALRTTNFIHAARRVDHPLRYNEMCAASTLGAALHDITPITISETYVQRNNRDSLRNGNGRIDYWCRDTSCNTDWFIEFKRAEVCTSNRAMCSNAAKKWKDAVDQIQTIDLTNEGWVLKKSYFIALLLVYFFDYAKKVSTEGHWDDVYDGIRKELTHPNPNWSTLWDVSNDPTLSPLDPKSVIDEKAPENWSVGLYAYVVKTGR